MVKSQFPNPKFNASTPFSIDTEAKPRCQIQKIQIRRFIVVFFIFVFTLNSELRITNYSYAQDLKEEEALYVAKKAFDDGFYDVSQNLLERFLLQYPRSPKTPEAHLLLGRSFFHQNKFLEALAKFEELIPQPQAKTFKDVSLYWMAEVHFKGNSFGKAASFYKKIIDEFPTSAYLGASYYSLAWCLFQEQKFEEAITYFTIVEEKFPQEASFQDAPLKIIECLYNLKDYLRLKDRLGSGAKLSSWNAEVFPYFNFYQAEADYYLNNFKEALAEYSAVLKNSSDPKLRALSNMGLAWSYLKLKQYKEAESAFLDVKEESLDKRAQEVLRLGQAILMVETNRVNQAKGIYEELIGRTDDPLVLVQAYLGKADALYNLAEYQEAIRIYKEALSQFKPGAVPQEMMDKVHYNLSWAYLKQGEFKEAIDEFQRIVKETDDKIVKVSALCQIGDAYQDSGDYAQAQKTYSAILKDFPDSFYSDYVQYQLGLTWLKASNYEAAIMSFQAMKRNFPQSKLLDDATYALGLAYFQRQDYESSRLLFESFEQEFKDSALKPQALYLLGTSFYNLSQFAKAIEVFKDVIRLYSQDIDLVQKAEYEIADCFDQMGEEKEAVNRFNALRSKYPDSSLTPEVMWWLGEYYYKHNDLELARRYFSALINDFPKSPLVQDAYYAIGTSLEEESRHTEAIENFRKVIELGKADLHGQAAIAIADIYVKQEDLGSALKAYVEIARDYPNLAPSIYPKMAQLYYKTADYSRALELYRKCLDTVPVREMGNIQFKIAEVLQAQGAGEEAIEAYLKVTYLYSENDTLAIKALLRVAQVYEDKENFKEAMRIYKRITETDAEEAKYARERIEWIREHVK
ncbi:MAG: tetratricopeptide repeat protein [Candidatus Omnitrophota bacterium]